MEARAALWTLVGIFIVFKVATTAMIVAARPEATWGTVALFIAFHWPVLLLGLVFAVGPVLFWMRLVRVRTKRARLQEAEWRVGEPASRR